MKSINSWQADNLDAQRCAYSIFTKSWNLLLVVVFMFCITQNISFPWDTKLYLILLGILFLKGLFTIAVKLKLRSVVKHKKMANFTVSQRRESCTVGFFVDSNLVLGLCY